MSWRNADDQRPGPTVASSGLSSIASSGPPILALIILHGRTETKEASRRIAEHTLRYTHDRIRGDAADSDRTALRELLVITMVRLVDPFGGDVER